MTHIRQGIQGIRWGVLLMVLALFSARPAAAERLQVVSTVAPITNIVKNIGGDRILLDGLVPEGTDSHTFEPAPSDVKTIVRGDLFFMNGLHLEIPSEKLIQANMKPSARIVKLGDNTVSRREWIFDFSFPEEEGSPNPHLWLNVAYAMKYAELVREALVQADPDNAQFYKGNAKAYLARLDRLDQAIKKTFSTIPKENRKLVTYHDSWAYFCPRYGCTVIGAIQPSSFADPPPREVARIIDQLRAEKVPAVFGSEVFPSKILKQIGREAGVKFISTLRDDDLPGPVDAKEHTYIGMMVENVETMAKVLGGDPSALKGIDPTDMAGRR